jgi:hypothetical protein
MAREILADPVVEPGIARSQLSPDPIGALITKSG